MDLPENYILETGYINLAQSKAIPRLLVIHCALLPPSLSTPIAGKGHPPAGRTTAHVSKVSEVRKEAKKEKGVLLTSSLVEGSRQVQSRAGRWPAWLPCPEWGLDPCQAASPKRAGWTGMTPHR